MDHHAIAQDERISRRNGVSAVLTTVAGELPEAERIDREQSVRACVPVGRPRVLRVIENRHADILGPDVPGIVDPVRALAPDPLFSGGPVPVPPMTPGSIHRLPA